MKNTNKNKCHSKLDLESHLFLKQQQGEILNQVQDDAFFYNNGFTLIELLVVVLIIGILAAVALPQYQKAVEKSRAAQAISLVKSVHQAMQAYYLANNTGPSSFDELSIEIPWTVIAGTSNKARANGDWLIQLYESDVLGVETTRKTGKYKGAGFIMFVTEGVEKKSNQLYCTERTITSNENYQPKFDDTEGDYCTKIWKATSSTNPSGRLRLFPMP